MADDDVVLIQRSDVRDFNPSNILPLSDQERKQICDWIRPTQYDDVGSEYQKHRSAHLSGTGNWVFTAAAYRQWYDHAGTGVLWIRGIPGTGKSVLAADLIHELAQEDYPVLYFFARHTIAANHTPHAALRDWLSQILDFSPPLQHQLQEKMKQGDVESASMIDLYELLRVALSHTEKIYCVVDALDEMDQNSLEPFLHVLDEMSRLQPNETKVIMTSRPVATVEKVMRQLSVLDVQLSRQLVEKDIELFIRNQLSSSMVPLTYHEEVVKAVLDKSDGIFLYAELAMSTILQRGTDVQRALLQLPARLSVMYSTLLDEHSRRSGAPDGMLLLVLQCVTHAIRPLRLLELAGLIKVVQNRAEGLGETKNLIRSLCGPLIQILPDETTRVVHHSLTEYLTTTNNSESRNFPRLEPKATHYQLAQVCLTYLASGCLDQVPLQRRPGYPSELHASDVLLLPSVHYASEHWHKHLKISEITIDSQSAVTELLRRLYTKDNVTKMAILMKLPLQDKPLLFTAIALNLHQFAREILVNAKLEASDITDLKDTALTFACMERNHSMVQLLLQHGAKALVNCHRVSGDCESEPGPLETAVINDDTEIIASLLAAGASPYDIGWSTALEHRGFEEYNWPAHHAYRNACLETISLFLPYITNAHDANDAASYAIRYQPDAVMEYILQHPMVDITRLDYPRRRDTLLNIACAYRRYSAICFLLRAGSNPNAPNTNRTGQERSAIHALVSNDYDWHSCAPRGVQITEADIKNWFKALMSAGADPNQTNTYGQSPLHLAEDLVAIRCLLEHGADPNQTNANGETPLHLAKDPVAIRCLLEHGADPNAIDRTGKTLLHHATEEEIIEMLLQYCDINQKETLNGDSPLLATLRQDGYGNRSPAGKVRRLIAAGADINAVGDDGNSALHLIAWSIAYTKEVTLELAELLIAEGADVTLRNNMGQTPLHMADPISSICMEMDDTPYVFTTLLKAGADTEARDKEGRTVLFWALASKRDITRSEIEHMIRKGCQINSRDTRGRTILHAVMHCGSRTLGDILEYLVSLGLDPMQTDHQGNTLFHEASHYLHDYEQCEMLSKTLLGMGVDPKQENCQGETLLHMLCCFLPSSHTRLKVGYDRRVNAGIRTSVDFFLDYGLNPNHQDKRGITPLHIASTFSEYNSRRLLETGADPRIATDEGLTALHLASRSGAANVLGIIRDWCQSELGQDETMAFVDATDCQGRRALYYACASGRAESVQLLIDAGANVTIVGEVFSLSPWYGCVYFEEEQANCDTFYFDTQCGNPLQGNFAESRLVGSLTLASRPRHIIFDAYRPSADVPRLEEILRLLVFSAPTSAVEAINSALSAAMASKHVYTIKALLDVRSSISGQSGDAILDEEIAEYMVRNEECCTGKGEPTMDSILKLLSCRAYSAVLDRLKLSNCITFLEPRRDYTYLHQLARDGFASIISQSATREDVAKLDSKDWWLEQNMYPIPPLLFVACERQLPNMDVLRVLIEEKGCDPNSTMIANKNTFGERRDANALHTLVEGGHWWQIAQALPYLCERGARLETKGGWGHTPLLLALEWSTGPGFNLRAIKTLLNLGADPNASDSREETCLVKAANNTDLFQLLVSHGAIVDPTAMIAIIAWQNIGLLEIVLKEGADPNMRVVTKQAAEGSQYGKNLHDPDKHNEMYPIDFLASIADTYFPSDKEKETMTAMFRMLLRYGASPTGQYESTTVAHRIISNRIYPDTSYSGINPVISKYFSKEGIYHDEEERVTGAKLLLRPLLEHAGLETEARDIDGKTLLLAACQELSRPEFLVRLLLERGADVHAADNRGWNALNYLLRALNSNYLPKMRIRHFLPGTHNKTSRIDKHRTKYIEDIRYIVTRYPDLVTVSDKDGRPPLHDALLYRDEVEVADVLFDAGADVCQPTNEGDTALHVLLAGLWVINADDVVGRSPLVLGPQSGFSYSRDAHPLLGRECELLDQIIARGGDINARNEKGETPVFAFFGTGDIEVDVDMSHHPDDLHGEDEEYYQNLELAAAVEKEHLLWHVFDDLGVDRTVVDYQGQSLLHIVASRADKSFKRAIYEGTSLNRFRFLLEKGLDPMLEDKAHRTPLDVAAFVGHSDILELFQ